MQAQETETKQDQGSLMRLSFSIVGEAYIELRKQANLLPANDEEEQLEELAECRTTFLAAELIISRNTALLMTPQYLVGFQIQLVFKIDVHASFIPAQAEDTSTCCYACLFIISELFVEFGLAGSTNIHA